MNEPILRAAKIMAAYDPFGPLHIVVDDGNVDDEWLDSCAANPALTDADREILALLKSMTVEERERAWEYARDLARGTYLAITQRK